MLYKAALLSSTCNRQWAALNLLSGPVVSAPAACQMVRCTYTQPTLSVPALYQTHRAKHCHSMCLLQVMIRAGFTDASLDEEARQLVAAAEAVRLADHGTESVLLLAVQAELEQLTAANESLAAANQQLQLEVQQLRDRWAG